MKKFNIGETFKLKGCRKTWTIISTFEHKGVENCVAVSTLVNNPGIERLGIFAINEHGEIYQRAT